MSDEKQPCPGSCNRKWRMAELQADVCVRAAVEAVRPLSHRDVELVEHSERMTPGDPVWCAWCSAAISDAIWRIIELAFELWAVGHDGEPSSTVVVVNRRVHYGYATTPDAVVARASRGAAPPERVVIGYTETLSCRHTIRRYSATVPKDGVRSCWRCAIETPGGLGQLMPSAAGPSAPAGKGAVKGSPSLSPSLMAVDELVAWVVSVEDYLREELDDPRPVTRVTGRDGGRRPLTTEELMIVSSRKPIADSASNEKMTTAVHYLHAHHEELMRTPRAEEIGREILRLERRAGRQAGSESMPSRLPVPCPSCDRRALWARPGAAYAKCRNCGAVSSMDHAHLVAAIHGA